MSALGLDVLAPGQLAVEVWPEVLNFGFHWDRGSVQKDRRTSNMSRGEGNVCGLRRVDVNFPHFEPVVEEGQVVLEVLGGDVGITMCLWLEQLLYVMQTGVCCVLVCH